MGWIRRLLGEKSRGEDLGPLVQRLTFYQDHTVFQDALREVTSFTATGNDLGACALREAIRIRSRQKKIEFSSVNFAELKARSALDPVDAKDRLMDLALLGRILYNPSFSQGLLVVIMSAAKDGETEEIKQEIFVQAGADQGLDFQLLYCLTCSFTELANAGAERSAPDQESDKIPRAELRRVA